MTVVWKLSENEIKEAVKEWLQNKHALDADGADIEFERWANGVTVAQVRGVVNGFATGPYR